MFLAVMLAGCTGEPPADQAQAADTLDPSTHPSYDLYAGLAMAPEVLFTTDHGDIRLILYDHLMPETAGRFAQLVESGFYDGTLIHRVVDDFVIQGGDPSDTGQLGSGQTIGFESYEGLEYVAGSMGLARDVDPDSGDSQWFIAELPQPHLTDASSTTGQTFGTYALYGQVFDGMETVRRIASVATLPGADRPIEDVHVQRATLHGPPLDLDPFQYPRQNDGPFALGGETLHVDRPWNLFAGHPFEMIVTVEPDGGPTVSPAAPAPRVLLEYTPASDEERDEQRITFELHPVPDDPWVYQGTVVLPEAREVVQWVSYRGATTTPLHVDVTTLDPLLQTLLPETNATTSQS